MENINKNNYKLFGFTSRKGFRRFKKDMRLHSHVFNKSFKPSKSSIYSDLKMSLHGGKSKKCRVLHLKG